MYYVVNTARWPLWERARSFRDFDSAQKHLDRRARYVLSKYGEPEAERYISNSIIFTSTRSYYWYAFKNGIFGFALILLIIYCVSVFAFVE